MAKITIIDGNDEIELSTAPKENIKAYMVKGEAGSDGISPTATVSKVDDTTTITITDKNGTTEADVLDGFDPTITTSKTNKTTTLTITDINGTRTAEILDGIDLTGGVPTNGVIGFDGVVADIPNGYEAIDDNDNFATVKCITDAYDNTSTYAIGDYCIYNNALYKCTTTISTAENFDSTKWAVTNLASEVSSVASITDSYSTSTTDGYSANYVNSLNTYSTTEKRVGTWKDGKPLYRITLEYSVSTGSSSYDVSSLNIDNIAKQNHQIYRYSSSSGATDIEGPFYASSTDYFRSFVRKNTNTIETRLQGNYTTYTQITTLEYTKTTD